MYTATKKKRAVLAFLTATVLFISSSAFPQGREYERSRIMSVAATQKGTFGPETPSDYLITPGDLLEISVWREPELSRDVRVRPDGKFSYPLIGTVRAAGTTIEQLEKTIRMELIQYVKYPEITVEVKEFSGNMILVLGEVNYPGLYTYKGSSDVLQAVALAGDFTPDAKRESVIVISDNFTDKPSIRRVNVFRSFRHGAAGSGFLLKPNDVVYVPKTFLGDLNKTINDLQPTIDLFTSFMGIRSDVKMLYYNRDRPVKLQQGN